MKIFIENEFYELRHKELRYNYLRFLFYVLQQESPS